MADVRDSARSSPAAEQSTAQLVQRATEQISQLIRDELTLARIELAEKGRNAGIGFGLFGGGGVLALYGLGALLTAVVLLLALAMPAWVAALIVAVVLFGLAAVLAATGRGRVRRAVPPVPTAATDSLRADVGAVTDAVRERRRS